MGTWNLVVPMGRDGEAPKGWGAGRGGESQAGGGLLSVQEMVREEPLEADGAGFRRCLTERRRSTLAPDQVLKTSFPRCQWVTLGMPESLPFFLFSFPSSLSHSDLCSWSVSHTQRLSVLSAS